MTDEFVEPVVCTKDGKVKEGDSIIFINFRPDRRGRSPAALWTPPSRRGAEKGLLPGDLCVYYRV